MQPRKPRRKRASARRPRPWLPVAIVGVAAILAVVLIVIFSNSGGSSNSGPIATPGPTHAVVQGGSTVGSDGASVTMVEYFKFDCPHCADFASEVEPQLETDYIDPGKLRIEFHPMALEGDLLLASEAVFCAGDQDRFLEYYDLVFANINLGFSESNLKKYASVLKLDTNAFNSCLDSGKYQNQVMNETNQALTAGVQSTPTFFIGKTSDIDRLSAPYTGQTRLSGVEQTDPVAPFTAAIDEVLATVQ